MKRLILFTALLLLTACAADGPVAPREGREGIGNPIVQMNAANDVMVLSKPRQAQSWPMVFASATNDRPHVRMGKDFHITQPGHSVSIGKGVSDDHLTLAGPVVANGVAYTLDSVFGLQATDIKHRKKKWYRRLADISGTTTKSIGVAVSGSLVYAVAGDGTVIATDLNGQEVWKRELKTLLRSAPVVRGKQLFLSSLQNELFVLDTRTGKTIWQQGGERSVTHFLGMGSPAVGSSVVVMPTTNGRVNAMDVTTGVLLWTDNLWSRRTFNPILDIPHITAAPVIDKGTVYLIGNAGKMGAYRLQDGTSLFTVGIGGRETPQIIGDTLFIVTNQNRLVALNKRRGEQYWDVPLSASDKRAVWFGPVGVNHTILVVSSVGDMVAYDMKTGKELERSRQEAFAGAPVFADGVMMILTQSGDLKFYQ